MENTTIEITEEQKKVGAGIITMSALYLLGQVIIILILLSTLIFKDAIIQNAQSMGISDEINTGEILIPLVIATIIAIAVILILVKKPIGAFLFIGIEVLSLIYKVITSGITMGTIVLLIFPVLMIFFIYKKKDIYFGKA